MAWVSRDQDRALERAVLDPLGQLESAVSAVAPWDSIIDFATHPYFCGKRLYPRQRTLLRLIYLEVDQMTQYDLDVIEQWRVGFADRSSPCGVQSDIWQRIQFLRDNGYRHFPHILACLGRRASKGMLGGVLGAETLAYMYSLNDWQAHYGLDPGIEGELTVVATSQSQAARRQFADIRRSVESCKYLRPAIASNKGTELTIRTPADVRRIAELRASGVPIDREIASLRAQAVSSSSASGRGGAGFANFYDEFAHVLSGSGSVKSSEEIYEAYQPSLDQFGKDSLTYIPSSPYCLSRDARVLTEDLRWVRVDSLRVGDRLIGFDEHPPNRNAGGNNRRTWQPATVTETSIIRAPRFKMVMESGKEIICTGEHLWLCAKPRRTGWRKTKDIKPGDRIHALNTSLWEKDESWSGGYLAGFFDAEGHLGGQYGKSRGLSTLGYGQNAGPVQDLVENLLKERGFDTRTKQVSKHIWSLLNGGAAEMLRFLGTVRPERLLAKFPEKFYGGSVHGAASVKDQVVSVEPFDFGEVVALGTSTATLIAEGLLSHNTMTGKFYELFKQGAVVLPEGEDGFRREQSVDDLDEDDVLEAQADPEMLVIQVPSWELYKDWERSPQIPVVKPAGGEFKKGPRFKRPIQWPPDGDKPENLRMRLLERRNPEKFGVERRAKFANVMDAYLDPDAVDRMFAEPGWRPPLAEQDRGYLTRVYRVHCDPSKSGANFACAIGHLEEAPPDEHGEVWPHVVFDWLHVWKPEDFPLDETGKHRIDYVTIQRRLEEVLTRYPSAKRVTFDQWNCQAGGTLVPTSHGLLRLDEIVGATPPGSAVGLDLGVQSHHCVGSAREGYHKGVAPTRRITTKLGNVVEATPEHRLWVRKAKDRAWHADNPWGFAEARDVEVGDWLCVRRNTALPAEEFDLTGLADWDPAHYRRKSGEAWTPTCDENLGEALGLLVAEGDYGTSPRRDRTEHFARFGNSDDEVLERYRSLMEKSFGGTWRAQVTDEWMGKYHFGWVRKTGRVPRLLHALGLTGTAAGKVVPWVIRRSPAPVVKAFLRGYFEGDGGVCFGRGNEVWLEATTTSEEIARTVQQLLLAVGVFSTVWEGTYRYKGESRRQWRVKMYGQDLLDFADAVGFAGSRKQGELATAVSTILANPGRGIGLRSKNTRHGDEQWVRVTRVEESEADCYDLSVPGPETYVANGVVSHNSAGMISHLQHKFSPRMTIAEETATAESNRRRAERFKSALNLGWVHCLAGETGVLTPDGVRPIRDLAGTTARLLTTSQNDGRGGGKWVEAPVRSFGVQPLLKVTLRRNGVDKIIHATAGHRWFVRQTNGTASHRQEVLTADLRPGQRLSYCYAQRHKATRPSPIGIAHGFTYGDGTRSRKGSVAQFCGDKDKALIPYFDLHPIVDIAPGVRRALDLPRFFKEKVDLTESPSYLYGWLAGYMAADGHVTKDGRVEIDSNDRSSLEHVRAVCNLLGIHTTSIRTKNAYGHGYKPDGKGYATNLDVTALTEEFFLTDEHRQRWLDNQDKQRKDYRGYTVVAVEETDRVEEVFCAVVDGTHSFTLEDNILTGNCYRDSLNGEEGSLLEMELKFLTEKNGRVDRQQFGPCTTKDLADCYDDQTEVLTEHGWKLFVDVLDGERVATLSPAGDLEYQEPTDRVARFYEGPMVSCEAGKFDFRVTPGHRLLGVDRHSGGRVFVTAEALLARQSALDVPRTARVVDREPGVQEFPRCTPPAKVGRSRRGWTAEQDDYLRGNYAAAPMGDLCAVLGRSRSAVYNRAKALGATRGQIGERTRGLGSLLPPTKRVDLARFIGFWLAEGRKLRGVPGNRVEVCQKKAEGVLWADAVFSRLGWPVRRTESAKCVVWAVRSKELKDYVRRFEGPGHELLIPDEVFASWTSDEMEALLEGLLVGDGTWHGQNGDFSAFSTTSRRLADDVQRLALHVGLGARVRRQYPAGVDRNGFRANHDLWQVGLDRSSHSRLPSSRMTAVDYSGMVYCLTVPNSTLLVRRNGVAMWCGNCVMTVASDLLHNALDRWSQLLIGATSFGSTDVAGMRSGRELERAAAMLGQGGDRSARAVLSQMRQDRTRGLGARAGGGYSASTRGRRSTTGRSGGR